MFTPVGAIAEGNRDYVHPRQSNRRDLLRHPWYLDLLSHTDYLEPPPDWQCLNKLINIKCNDDLNHREQIDSQQ